MARSTVADITVSLNITDSNDAEPDRRVDRAERDPGPAFRERGGTGQNFTNTVFDDAAETPITAGTALLPGRIQPSAMLSSLIGLDCQRHLDTCRSSITRRTDHRHPRELVAQHHAADHGHAAQRNHNATETATQFQIGFPLQQLSGTYTVQLGPDIQDAFGDAARYQPERGPRCFARPGSEQPDDHRPVHSGRPAQDRFRPPPQSGRRRTGDLHHRRARQLHRSGRYDDFGGQRPAGPDQSDLSHRPRSLGDALLRHGRTGQVAGPVVQRRGERHHTPPISPTPSSMTMRAPRSRTAPRRSSPRSTRKCRSPRFAGLDRVGDLDAGHSKLDDGQQARRYVQRLVAELPEAAADHRAWASRAAMTPASASASSR